MIVLSFIVSFIIIIGVEVYRFGVSDLVCCCFITHPSVEMTDPKLPGILHCCVTRIMTDFPRKIVFEFSSKKTISKYKNEKVCIFCT